MPDYSTSGTENLRADATVKTGSTTASPSGGGKDAGGTESPKVERKNFEAGNTRPASPPQESLDRPAGVQEFDDDMGRK
jgi:hypothetical protein